jgi:NitT/TauT family transport system substrate-binding protein
MKNWLVAAALSLSMMTSVLAEVKEVTIAKQFGFTYLQMLVMEEMTLIEKHAAQLGVPNLKVNWVRLSGGGAVNDALLSGSVHVIGGGVGPLITLWDRTKGGIKVKGLSGLNSMPFKMITRNANYKSIKDFTDSDRIAVPTIKVSPQATLVQMAAAKAFGFENYAKLDKLTVALPHPDAAAAMISGSAGITAHVASPPFDQRELRAGFTSLMSSYDFLGDKASIGVVAVTEKFYNENPIVTKAIYDALADATTRINADKRWASELYLRVSNDRDSLEDTLSYLTSPEVEFTLTPRGTKAFAEFMAKIGTIRAAPEPWTELFFPIAHSLPGS